MMKILFCAVLVMLLPCMAYAQQRVFDEADLFTEAEIQEMTAWIGQIQQEYHVDAVVLTSYDAPYDYDLEQWNESLQFANQFYDRGGFGLGEDDAGILYFIDMSNRVPTISTTGAMNEFLEGSRLDTLLDQATDTLRKGGYGTSAIEVLEMLQYMLEQGRDGGEIRYDAKGGRLMGVFNVLTSGEIFVALLLAALAALGFILAVNHSYSIKGTAYRYSLADFAGIRLQVDKENFLRQSVIRRARSQGGSGGGSRSSGGGGRHGGGSGGRF